MIVFARYLLKNIFSRFLPLGLAALIVLVSSCEEGLYQSVPPVSGEFSINSGEPSTFSRSVSLSVLVDNVDDMRFSNDLELWSEWERFASAKSWLLGEGAGEKIVYGEFRRNGSLAVVAKTARVTLANIADCEFLIENGLSSVFSNSVTLNMNSAGMSQMRFSNDNSSWSWALSTVPGN
ncbi:MAG: hypothetical protein GY754_32600 [bacterium]|nr:hypothetical protein [bacterium]